MKVFTSNSQVLGEEGEKIAADFLRKKGYDIVERNFTVISGEIDIVAKKKGKFHFVEVKAGRGEIDEKNVTHETTDLIKGPEENFHRSKAHRLKKAIGIYLSKYNISHETDFHVDLVVVILDTLSHTALVDYYPDVFELDGI